MPTAIPNFTGGANATAGKGAGYRVTVNNNWTVNDTFAFQIVTASQIFDFGIGRLTGLVPVETKTLNDRVHFVANSFWCGSDNGDPMEWEQQAPGAFKIDVSNRTQEPEALLALCSFQGKMALWSRQTVQLWLMDANPDNIAVQQVLSNIGIISGAAESLGDFDVLFPSDSGIRSLRVQTINLNGYITDIGCPIDTLIKAAIKGQTLDQLSRICAIIEPIGNRFLIYFPTQDSIYALSYYPTAKIIAWSAWKPTYAVNNNQVPFVPEKFLVYNGTVYMRGTSVGASYFFKYGGSYDNSKPIVFFPWLDLKKPGVRKTTKGIDIVIQGQWTMYGSMDFNGVNKGAVLKNIITLNKGKAGLFASVQLGLIGWVDSGYHAQLAAIADDNANPGVNAKFSELVFYYEPGDEKP